MLNPNSINPLWIQLIKILSPILIVGALYVDGTILYDWLQGLDCPKAFIAIGAVGSVALAAHMFEGIVAAAMAKKRGLNSWRYGIYTFFVGTVAFVDLLNIEESE